MHGCALATVAAEAPESRSDRASNVSPETFMAQQVEIPTVCVYPMFHPVWSNFVLVKEKCICIFIFLSRKHVYVYLYIICMYIYTDMHKSDTSIHTYT